MSLVGDNITRATAAGLRAAQIAPLVHARPEQRDSIRVYLYREGSPVARRLLDELEDRWRRG